MHDFMNRREFLRLAGMSALSGASLLSGCAPAIDRGTMSSSSSGDVAQVSLRIAAVKVDLAPKQVIQTIGYNGSAPGPLLRVKEGQRVTVDVRNDSDVPELVHWHGFYVPSEVDGAMEEGTPMVPPGSSRQYSFTAKPGGHVGITPMPSPAKISGAACIRDSLDFFILSRKVIRAITTGKFFSPRINGILCL